MRFEPRANDLLRLRRRKYWVQPHPSAAPDQHMPFAAEGRKGTVYRLRDTDGTEHALKVFKRQHRVEHIQSGSSKLERLADYDGFRAAKRFVIPPESAEAREHPDLAYAVLMPWIAGRTWYDVLLGVQSSRLQVALGNGRGLATSLLTVLHRLERLGAAHTDIAPGNVVVDLKLKTTELLDLEDMFIPNGSTPVAAAAGTNGYRHAKSPSLYCPEGDRYASAVMAAEMLIVSEPDLARLASDEGFFQSHVDTAEGRERYSLAAPWLATTSPSFAEAFGRTWTATSLSSCPSVGELLAALSTDCGQHPAPEVLDPSAEQIWVWAPLGGAAASDAAAPPAPSMRASGGGQPGQAPPQRTSGGWRKIALIYLIIAALTIGCLVALTS